MTKCARACRFYSENAERFLEDETAQTAAARSFVRFEPMGPVLAIMKARDLTQALAIANGTPYALTGGIYLLWLLNYNFSVAVWVGFIALFGTAVQTGVVMVIYLKDSVERRRERDDTRKWRQTGQKYYPKYRTNHSQGQPMVTRTNDDPYGPRPMDLDATQHKKATALLLSTMIGCAAVLWIF